jgi:hypothetical protein
MSRDTELIRRAPAHLLGELERHAWCGGVHSARMGLAASQNPYEDPHCAAAWTEGYDAHHRGTIASEARP